MSPKVRKSRAARNDLLEIFIHLAHFSARTARRFLKAMQRACDLLVLFPQLGGLWESPNLSLSDVRVWPVRGFKRYLIFYRPLDDGIEILRVLHASRDFHRIFNPGMP